MASLKKFALQGLFAQHARALRKFDQDLLVLLEDLLTSLGSLLNQGLTFADNFDGKTTSYTSSGTPDTEEAVAHTLGKAPTGFIVIDIDKAGAVYRGPTAFTATNIYLKCSTASTAIKVLVF